MTELKFERKETLMREEAVALLRSIADALDGSDRQAELELGSDTISLPVGSEIRMELEVELDDELELELKWAVQEPAAHEPESSGCRCGGAWPRHWPSPRFPPWSRRGGLRSWGIGAGSWPLSPATPSSPR